MTFPEYQQFSQSIHARAERVSQSIRARAIAISKEQLGPDDGFCFLAAHNWHGQSWMTPAQNDAAREILYLERLSWIPGELADRIISRAWKRCKLAFEHSARFSNLTQF